VVALRSRRLEALFGKTLDTLTAADLRGLVNAQAQEAFDLDFKATHYGGTDKEKRALAVDVAAMANTAGGVILIGIDEDERARATAAPGVEVSDAERGRIRQIVASQVSPFPTFDVEMISDEAEVDSAGISSPATDAHGAGARPAHGFMMIAVVRSPSAPHAVLVDNSLRFPKRNGATTRYLSEPEVAAAYADRAAGAARLGDRVAEVGQDAFRRLERERDPWLVVTLVPELPGDLAITTASFNEFRQKTIETGPALIVPEQISLHRVRVGRRRFLADGTGDPISLAQGASLELHTDGAGAYGLICPTSGDVGCLPIQSNRWSSWSMTNG
jgi:Schlafen, AlbA_2